jgi:hypothetical protein
MKWKATLAMFGCRHNLLLSLFGLYLRCIDGQVLNPGGGEGAGPAELVISLKIMSATCLQASSSVFPNFHPDAKVEVDCDPD